MFVCSVCADSYEEAVSAVGHDAGEWVVVEEAGAFSQGTKELRCTKDEVILEKEMIPQTFPLSLGATLAIVGGVVGIVVVIIVILKKRK